MSYYRIVSTTAVGTGHTKVNYIHNVWPLTVCTTCSLGLAAPAYTRSVNCERPHIVNIINLGVTCSNSNSRHYTGVGHSPSESLSIIYSWCKCIANKITVTLHHCSTHNIVYYKIVFTIKNNIIAEATENILHEQLNWVNSAAGYVFTNTRQKWET